MKNQISHNGHVHQIVDGIDLYEMSNGNITHQLDEADDHFRFSVTGTDYNTGLRRPFRFLLNAGLRRVSRGSLDLVYTLNLIDETVKEALARENHFITGNMPRGAQFERAFTRQILTPNTMAYRLPSSRVVCFDGTANALDTSTLEAADTNRLQKAVGRQFVVVARNMVYTYSIEDQPKWGVDDFVPFDVAGGFPDSVFPSIVAHFQRTLTGKYEFPVSVFQQSKAGEVRLIVELADEEALTKFATNGPALKKPVPVPAQPKKAGNAKQAVQRKPHTANEDYRAALRENDLLMASGTAGRLPWKTNTGPIHQVS